MDNTPPTLVVVSGPLGSGKTTLAHRLASAVGCPAICRDEIKEGMVHTTTGFVPAPGDELTARTLPVFFGVLELLLRAGVTTVAEAAFTGKVWRPRLEPLAGLAQFRIVHCTVDAAVAFERNSRRLRDTPSRRAHADPRDPAEHAATHRAFDRVSMDAPYLEVDTTDGYRPALAEIVAFVNGHEQGWCHGHRTHAGAVPRRRTGHADGLPGLPARHPGGQVLGADR